MDLILGIVPQFPSILFPVKILWTLLAIASLTKRLDVFYVVEASLVNWDDMVALKPLRFIQATYAFAVKLSDQLQPLLICESSKPSGFLKALLSYIFVRSHDFL